MVRSCFAVFGINFSFLLYINMKNRNLSNSDNWETPESLVNYLQDVFWVLFDFDPCPLNNDLEKFNGLFCEWWNCNFVNPPYSRDLKEKFILKWVEEMGKWKCCIFLLPVSTSTKIFHNYILRYWRVYFLKKRVKFEGINTFWEIVKNKTPMHDSMIVVFDKKYKSNILWLNYGENA